MATFARHVDVDWTGTLMEGSGTAKAGTGAFTLPVTFPSRIAAEGDGKTTPEELMAASHAICYAMVLTNTIGKQGGKARTRARHRHGDRRQGRRRHQGRDVASEGDSRGARRDRQVQAERAGDRRREGLPDLERHPRQRAITVEARRSMLTW